MATPCRAPISSTSPTCRPTPRLPGITTSCRTSRSTWRRFSIRFAPSRAVSTRMRCFKVPSCRSHNMTTCSRNSCSTAAWNWYVKNKLKYQTDETYRTTGYSIIGPWDWHHQMPGFQQFRRESPLPDVAANLGDAMRKNPHLKVFSANGYYDLATPFFKTDFDLDQLDLPPNIYKNIQFYYYPSGHMLYLHLPTLAKYKADLAQWYDETDKQ